ncbi:DM13 domain-containing protein [Flavilitoribacter nigricans]|uniref:DM13 domain-containing protein n=1 Tax=Flavilitoribacter nigricans (strain ATCC 23147 / DSM 23189 / NBRC 102662 / NCIMB 1420 / SS-2) TaxID=1122177 RepID=A0A2D0NEV2_FLAN2|nr:DM13 domain-containing protein [Flavilitoribacter nigricans]PHN06900.1 hypothetical protein CRP01_09155 [Flavilitoribacter nigricans DSM 23189 = NBRC 102662]
MKTQAFFFSLLLVLGVTFTACEKDGDTQIIDSSQPVGAFMTDRSGDFIAQNGTPTTGMAAVGTDEDGNTFLRFNNEFTTELGTGTVSVYLSTSDEFKPDPGNGNPDLRLIGAVSQNGENYFRVSSSVASQFSHVILWCGSANIPFGYAPLQ